MARLRPPSPGGDGAPFVGRGFGLAGFEVLRPVAEREAAEEVGVDICVLNGGKAGIDQALHVDRAEGRPLAGGDALLIAAPDFAEF